MTEAIGCLALGLILGGTAVALAFGACVAGQGRRMR